MECVKCQRRIFVDVDDTLVLWQTNSLKPDGEYLGTPYTYNRPLIAALKCHYTDHPGAMIVIWSGGGRSYAKRFAEQIFGGRHIVTLGKEPDTVSLIRDGDIVIDDMVDFTHSGKQYGPTEWSLYD
jgi:hypothetical protein